MIDKKIKKLRAKFKDLNIDGYIVPKNDEFFSEYSQKNRLKIISNFSGSAGLAVILKKKNYLFVDGRYTIQAGMESGKQFQIVDYKKVVNCNMFKNLTLGIDPKIFTSDQIKKFFSKNNKIKKIQINLIDLISNTILPNSKPFFSLKKKYCWREPFNKNKENYKFFKKKEAEIYFY